MQTLARTLSRSDDAFDHVLVAVFGALSIALPLAAIAHLAGVM